MDQRDVDELSTATAQRIRNSHDSTQENDFTYGAEYDPSSGFENPIIDWYGLDSTMATFQHNQMPQSLQSNMLTMGSFDLTSMPDVLPITWFPVDQPFNHHLYSNRPPSPSYEQLVNPGIYEERGMMECRPNLPPSLVNQYQNTLWPTDEERGSNPEALNSNSDSNFFNDNVLSPYFPSENSAETHSPNTTTSTPRSSKSQPSNKQRPNSRRDHKVRIAVKKRRESTTALVRCMACKTSKIAVCSLSPFEASHTRLLIGSQCVGPPDCKRCQLTCIPGQMYTTIDLSEVLNFDKCSYASASICLTSNDRIGLEKEYELKRVYPPAHNLREVKVAFLQHHVKGPELKVECYYFEPDPTEPSQTTIYWKEERWKEAQTTAVSLITLKYDLEPYIERMVDIILDEVCNGPYYIARFFQDIQKLRKVSNRSYRFVA